MRDWTRLVRERLILDDLSPQQQEETIAELAAHLDDLYQERRNQGSSESEGIAQVLSEITDCRHLSTTIRRVKREGGTVNIRTKRLWLPGLINLMIAMVVLMFEVRFDLHPRLYNTHSAAMMFYFPWLATLPFCGAFAAYLCRHAGGDRWTRLASASFPAVAYLACFAFVLLVNAFTRIDSPSLEVLWLMIFSWVLIPAAALLLGALPFLRSGKVAEPAFVP